MEQLHLSDFFTTKGQATDFSARLSKLSEMIYTTNFQLESALMKLFGIQKKEKFLTLLRENTISVDSSTALKDFIAKVQETITSLPVISLSLAFEPTEQTLKLVSDWFVMNIKKQVLFDFVIDPRLVAGVSIKYNGTFKDYSFQIPVENMITTLLKTSTTATQQPVQISPATTAPVSIEQNMQQTVNPATS